MKQIPHYLILFLIVCALTIGCEHVAAIPDFSLINRPDYFSPDKRYDLSVALVQNAEFKSTKYQRVGYAYILEIGPQLSKNTYELASLLFKEVTVVEGKNAIDGGVDAYLTPRVVDIERAEGGRRGDATRTTLVLEWKLENADKKLVWIETVKGVGIGSVPPDDADDEKAIETLLSQLFDQTYKEMLTSPEIENFAKYVYKPLTSEASIQKKSSPDVIQNNLDYTSEKSQVITGLGKQKPESLGQNDTINFTTIPKDTHNDKHGKYQIAILPWNIGYENEKENVIGKIATYINNSEDFEIIASYYDLPRNGQNNVKMIKNIRKDDIWIRNSIMGDKLPITEQVCKIGKELDADAIMVASFRTGLKWQNAFKNLRIYLIDVRSGKQCVFYSGEGLSITNFNQRIFEILDDVFNDYRDLKRDVAYKMN